MDEKKIVTWEMFKKYHEQLVGRVHGSEGDELVVRDLMLEDEIEEDIKEE